MSGFGEFEGTLHEHGRSFSTETQMMGFAYLQKRPPTREAAALAWNAAKLLLSSRLITDLSEVLRSQTEHLMNPTPDTDVFWERTVPFLRCYDWPVEDLIIAGAFERYAKAELLRQGYLVHAVERSARLRNVQRQQPVAMSEFQEERLLNQLCSIKEQTLAMSTLFKPAYSRLLGISDETLTELKGLAIKRNEIHFSLISTRSSSMEGALSRLLALRELSRAVLDNPELTVFPPPTPFKRPA